MGASPSGPLRCGSTTCSVNPAATAASNALPPFSRTPIATEDASQWVVATTPKVPRISGRVVKPGIRAFLLYLEQISTRLLRRSAPRNDNLCRHCERSESSLDGKGLERGQRRLEPGP